MQGHADDLRHRDARCRSHQGRFQAGLLPVLVALALIHSPRVSAQDLTIDSDRTHAEFWVRPLWLKRLGGVFPVVEGIARRDNLSGALTVDLQIDTRALQMSRASALVFAQSPEFFDTQNHPWIRFQSHTLSIERLSAGGPITGQLSLRGVSHGVTLQLAPSACTRPGIDCPVEVSGELSRSAFGMDSRRLVLGDTVHLAISAWLREADPDA